MDGCDSGLDKEFEEFICKKIKMDDGIVLSKDNSDVFNKFEKEFNVFE